MVLRWFLGIIIAMLVIANLRMLGVSDNCSFLSPESEIFQKAVHDFPAYIKNDFYQTVAFMRLTRKQRLQLQDGKSQKELAAQAIPAVIAVPTITAPEKNHVCPNCTDNERYVPNSLQSHAVMNDFWDGLKERLQGKKDAVTVTQLIMPAQDTKEVVPVVVTPQVVEPVQQDVKLSLVDVVQEQMSTKITPSGPQIGPKSAAETEIKIANVTKEPEVVAVQVPEIKTAVPEKNTEPLLVSHDELLSPEEKQELHALKRELLNYMPAQSNYSNQPIAQPQAYPMNNQPMQAAALAMQLQSSAMAMQAQASALMMQATQGGSMAYPNVMHLAQAPVMQQMPMVLGNGMMPMNSMQQEPSSTALPRQEKMSRLMNMLNQVMAMGVNSMQRLLVLVDLEIDIIERLQAGETGQRLEQIVEERNKTIKQSVPLIVSAYDTMVDLATTDAYGEGDARLYHYFVRSGRKAKIVNNGKKKFLIAMMHAMKHYQEMVDRMYQLMNPFKQI